MHQFLLKILCSMLMHITVTKESNIVNQYIIENEN